MQMDRSQSMAPGLKHTVLTRSRLSWQHTPVGYHKNKLHGKSVCRSWQLSTVFIYNSTTYIYIFHFSFHAFQHCVCIYACEGRKGLKPASHVVVLSFHTPRAEFHAPRGSAFDLCLVRYLFLISLMPTSQLRFVTQCFSFYPM